MSRVKKVLAILLVVLFVVTVTAGTVSAGMAAGKAGCGDHGFTASTTHTTANAMISVEPSKGVANADAKKIAVATAVRAVAA